MEQIITFFFVIFVIVVLFLVSILLIIALANKSLFCAIVYSFIFEHQDWKLYRKLKKQGIQHVLNGVDFSHFYREWNATQKEYGILEPGADKSIDSLTKQEVEELIAKHAELAEKYHYNEYSEVFDKIKEDDAVLSITYYNQCHLHLDLGKNNKTVGAINLKPMVEKIIKMQKDERFTKVLSDPKSVVSF